MIKIAICDDDIVQVHCLKNLIEYEFFYYTDDFDIQLYTNGEDLLEDHSTIEFDIVFLDIDMPQLSGFTIANSLRDTFQKIFITSHGELVYKSMDFQPFNFLRKNCNIPLEYGIKHVVKKLMLNFKQSKTILLEDCKYGSLPIMIRDIILIESNKHYVYFYIYTKDTPIKMRITLKDCETFYSNYDFIKVHRRYILNLKYLTKLDKFNDEIYIKALKKRITMSKRLKNIVEEEYIKFLRSTL